MLLADPFSLGRSVSRRLCVPHTIIITRTRNMTNDVHEQTPPDPTALSTKPDDAAKNQAACDLTGVVVVRDVPESRDVSKSSIS
jgi:hypothetical protein